MNKSKTEESLGGATNNPGNLSISLAIVRVKRWEQDCSVDAGGIRAYGYGLGYGYGGFRSHSYGSFRSSFGGFRSSGVGSPGAVGGGHSHGHNFAARR